MNPEAQAKLTGDYDEAVAYVHSLMKRAVEEKGEDYIYDAEADGVREEEINHSTCAYVARDAHRAITGPSCIIGHVLHYMGVKLERLAAHEGKSCDIVAIRVGASMPVPINEALRAAQIEQDSGNTWGLALRVFEDKLGIRTFTWAERQQMVGRSNG